MTKKSNPMWKYYSIQRSPITEARPFFDVSQASPACRCRKGSTLMKMSMQHWRNDTDGEKT